MQRAWLAAANHPLARAVLTLQAASFVNDAPLELCREGPVEGRQVIHWDSEKWSEAFSNSILRGRGQDRNARTVPSIKKALQLEGPHFPAGL